MSNTTIHGAPRSDARQGGSTEAPSTLTPACAVTMPARPFAAPDRPRNPTFRSESASPAGADEADEGMAVFACMRCHGVHDYRRLNAAAWNDVVAFMSLGMLYGSEVRRPGWWVEGRKKRKSRRPNRKEGKVVLEVERLLVTTEMKCRELAVELGMTMGTFCGLLGYVYRKYGVHSREDLRKRLAGKHGDAGACAREAG